ncbi:MAG: flagellar filament capping protein FliD [Pyrinomonadaceae bacterium]
MATTSFSGVGSGIDFSVIRDAILDQRTRPVTLMQTRVSDYNSRIESLKQLNTALATLTTASEALINRDLGSGRSAAAGDSSIMLASANSTANIGSFDVAVTRLASSLAQASRSFSSTTTGILAGGATTGTFELRKGGAATGTAITIDSQNNTLEGLRDAINAANAGVTASIVDVNGDGTGNQLVLNSKDTGATGRVELVETSATGTLTDLNIRSLNPPDADFAKLDAQLTINGLAITRSTNTVSDAVAGVTLNLKKVGSTTVGVTQSTDIENKLRGFITAYNTIQDAIANQYKKDGQNRPTGVLAGDSTLRNVQRQLRDATTSLSLDNGGTFTALTDLGITKDANGNLALDSVAFNEKLKNNPDDVKALLFGAADAQEGLFETFNTVSKNLSDSITGSVQNAIKGYQSSVTGLNARISDRLAALQLLKTTLTNRFSVADAAIGQLNGQGTALTNIITSLNNANQNS